VVTTSTHQHLELCGDADIILDGTDNFEIRYLINDVAVKLGKPWVYGARSQPRPDDDDPTRRNAVLRCVFEAAPAPGEAATCENGGVLSRLSTSSPATSDRSDQLLTGQKDRVNRSCLLRRLGEHTAAHQDRPLLGKVDCPCWPAAALRVARRRHGLADTSLCGRNAVQVAHRTPSRLNFEDWRSSSKPLGA